MKTSNKILLTFYASIAGAIFILLIAYRILTIVVPADSAVDYEGLDKQVITREYDYKDFQIVKISDALQVTVEQGDSYRIEITAPGPLLEKITVEKNMNTLHIHIKDGFNIKRRSSVKAKVTLPYAEKIILGGASDITLNNLTSDRLDMTVSGASLIEGNNVEINSLDIVISGASIAKLGGTNSITNAHINVSGASTLYINIAGGDITGNVSGASLVKCTGTINTQSVNVSGAGQFNKS